MYKLKRGIKQNPTHHWALPDRIFYGHGACHILAGVYLTRMPNSGYWPVWIKPRPGFRGNHVFVTNGTLAFDYHGYSILKRLLAHHKKGWEKQMAGWNAMVVKVDFSLLDTAELNMRNMRGPNQYYGDVIDRTNRYLDRIDHVQNKHRAKALL